MLTPGQQVRERRLRLAELTSSVGAGVLGFGLGVLLGRWFPISGIPVLVVGLGLHTWGMLDKHRLESGVVVESWWSKAAYWVCWILLAGLIGVLIMRGLTR
jgi:hypothetical protein